MFKRAVAMLLACVIILCTVTAALADVIRYCPTCNLKTMFRDHCYGILKRNSGHIQHTVNREICNYYEVYYKTRQNCVYCDALYDPNASHKHQEVHDTCGIISTCPF